MSAVDLRTLKKSQRGSRVNVGQHVASSPARAEDDLVAVGPQGEQETIGHLTSKTETRPPIARWSYKLDDELIRGRGGRGRKHNADGHFHLRVSIALETYSAQRVAVSRATLGSNDSSESQE